MLIRKESQSYNERRYGKPWIARVDFSSDPKGAFIWGDWIGQPGEPGELSVEAKPGEIVAQGQKDNRQPRNSAPDWYIVLVDGSLDPCESKIEAVIKSRQMMEAQNAPSN